MEVESRRFFQLGKESQAYFLLYWEILAFYKMEIIFRMPETGCMKINNEHKLIR